MARVVALLARNNVIFEITALDLNAHTESGVLRYRDQLADGITARLPRFNAIAQQEVSESIDQIRKTPVPLFLQAMTTFDMVGNIICQVPLYFVQRQPKELGNFTWIVDGKDPARTTNWEIWWSCYASGALATRSKANPMITLEGADYSHFDRFEATDQSGNENGIDLKLLFSDLQFSNELVPGLELVDIVTNAVRRAMTGRLSFEGWSKIPQLMIHRNHQYISLMLLEGASKEPKRPPYDAVVRHFLSEGKNMLSPRFQKMATED